MCPSRFDLSDPDAFAFCPSCGAGYRAGMTHCSECLTPLIPRADIERRALRDPSDVDEAGGMKRVYSTTRPLVAHMLAQALQEHDIAALVEGEQASLNFAQPLTIWVPQQHYEEAEKIISEIESTPPELEPDEGKEAEESESQPLETPSDSAFRAGMFLGMLVGVILGYGFFALWHRASSKDEHPTSSDRNADGIQDVWTKYSLVSDQPITAAYDDDFDGSPDQWLYYENGVVVRIERDRNDDQKPDDWSFFNNVGQVTKVEQDDDFNGQPDYWIEYTNGHGEFTEDLDFDGQVDSWGSSENGLLKERNISFRNDRVADKRSFYERSRSVRVEYDRDRDGVFEEVRLLNEFDEPIVGTVK